MAKIIHYIWSTILWGNAPKKKEWVDHRFQIYNDFVLKQFELQTEKEFEIVLHINPDFKYCLEKFGQLVSDKIHIHRFNKALPLSYENHHYASAPMLDKAKDYDWVYYTRLDTDDVHGIHTIERIREKKPDYKKAVILRYGFDYHTIERKVGRWLFVESPTSTIIFPSEIFVDAIKAAEYGSTPHRKIRERFPNFEFVSGYNYCVLIHGKNDSSYFRYNKMKKIYMPIFESEFPVLNEHFKQKKN